jgi:spermidine/putrescine transport system ATP-binding protein
MLELDGVTTTYGDLTAVDDVSLSVPEGELFCLLGPSGCGKSTLLRTIGGLESPAAGTIRLGGEDVTDAAPNERDCSLVFQDWALFPNKSVRENVAFGPKMAGVDRETRTERALSALEMVEIAEYADADPTELSGGQKQRVALARSLTVDPDLLLLDEPLSNLDRRLRETMQLEIRDIQADLGTTMVYVTHDQNEAFTLADRMGVMDDGALVQVGEPAAVYEDPHNRFVESFLGSTNFLECRVAQPGDRPVLETPLGTRVPAAIEEADLSAGDPVTLSIRPERIDVDARPQTAVEDGGVVAGERVTVAGTVTERIHRGSDVALYVSVGDADLAVRQPVADGMALDPGTDLALHWHPGDAVYFDAAGERYR